MQARAVMSPVRRPASSNPLSTGGEGRRSHDLTRSHRRCSWSWTDMDGPTPTTSLALIAVIGIPVGFNGCAGRPAPPTAAGEVVQQRDAGVEGVQQRNTEVEGVQQRDAGVEAPGTTAAPTPAARPPSTEPWLADERQMIDAGPQDAPLGEHGSVSLLPFFFDAVPIESWRYDACHAARKCAMRRFPQPAGGPNDAAVGMRWKDANQYCLTRELKVQSAPQGYAISSVLGKGAWPPVTLPGVGSSIVAQGFRCVRVSE